MHAECICLDFPSIVHTTKRIPSYRNRLWMGIVWQRLSMCVCKWQKQEAPRFHSLKNLRLTHSLWSGYCVTHLMALSYKFVVFCSKWMARPDCGIAVRNDISFVLSSAYVKCIPQVISFCYLPSIKLIRSRHLLFDELFSLSVWKSPYFVASNIIELKQTMRQKHSLLYVWRESFFLNEKSGISGSMVPETVGIIRNEKLEIIFRVREWALN